MSFSYTFRAGFFFLGGVSFTYPVLASFFLFFFLGFSITHPVLASFSSGEFLLHIPPVFPPPPPPLFFFFFFFFLCKEFLSHIPCFFFLLFFLNSFYQGSFSYTSRAGFIFIWGLSLTHPVLALILSADLL